MSDSEIRVADVNQVIDLFTSLKDKINSLKIIRKTPNIYTLPESTENPVLFAFKSASGAVTPATYTSDSAKDVLAVALGCTQFREGWNQAHDVTITTTGRTYASHDVSTAVYGGAEKIGVIYDGEKIYRCEHIHLSSGDTITFSTTASTQYTGCMFLVIDVNNVPHDFDYVLSQLAWNINGARSYSKDITITSETEGRCLVIACIMSNYTQTNPGTTNIQLNGQAINGIYQKQLQSYAYLSMVEVVTSANDVINLSASSADQTIAFYVIIRPSI